MLPWPNLDRNLENLVVASVGCERIAVLHVVQKSRVVKFKGTRSIRTFQC